MTSLLQLSADTPLMVGTDLDGYLSWLYLYDKFGCRLGGFYNLREIWLAPDVSRDDLLSSLWIDLDVYHPKLASFGQHIIKHKPGDQLPGRHPRSFNPNVDRGFALASGFQRKYPFATVHMLMWALDDDGRWNGAGPEAKALLWTPDSTWFNVQPDRFGRNAREWLKSYFDHDFLASTFDWTTSSDFLAALGKVQVAFRNCGFTKGASRAKDKGTMAMRPYTGWQCSVKDPMEERSKLASLLAYCADTLGLDSPQVPEKFHVIRGKRHQESVTVVIDEGGLDKFLAEYRVFSYAFPFYFSINYSTDLDPLHE